MKSLARMLREEEERRKKKEEKEKIKEEKKKEKERLKKIAHKKRLKKAQNKRCYAKRRKKELEKRKEIGDEFAYFTILLTRNRKKIKRIGSARWKTDAFKIYNDAIETNQETVKYPLKIATTGSQNKSLPIIYEILIIKKVGEDENTISQFRNEDGKFVDNVIIDKNQHIIVAKNEWLVEETFNVYGYNPIRDRKTYDFILNEIILNNIISKDDIRSITTYNNKLFINYIGDFDFVVCKNDSEAQRLYKTLERDIPKEYNKYVLFLGEINKLQVPRLLDRMMEKTGWKRITCKTPSL